CEQRAHHGAEVHCARLVRMRIRGLPETMDPYCLREGEAATLLAGHPWRRFAVLGDSIAEGVGDPLDGYADLGWADRVAEALRAQRTDLAYRNHGQHALHHAQVRHSLLTLVFDFQ